MSKTNYGMKIIVLMTAFFLAFGFSAQAKPDRDSDGDRHGSHHDRHGGSDDHDKGYQNGKPFAELLDAIDANQASIVDLQTTTAAIQSDLDAVTGEVAYLSEQVALHGTAITGLNAEIVSLQALLDSAMARLTELEANSATLAEIKALIDGEIAPLQEAINLATADLQAQLDAEKAAREALAGMVAASNANTDYQIAMLRDRINLLLGENASTDLSLAEIVANLMVITTLQSDITSLQGQVNANTNQLVALQTAFDAHADASSGAVLGRELVLQPYDVTANGLMNFTANCPAGKVVVGGGYISTNIKNLNYSNKATWTSVFSNRPNGDFGWTLSLYSTYGVGNYQGVIYAICVNPG